jgi:hypothetical protein
MTLEEAKLWIGIMRNDYLLPEDDAPTIEALDIALSLIEREPTVAALLKAAIDKEGLVDGERDESCTFCEAIADLRDWSPGRKAQGSL